MSRDSSAAWLDGCGGVTGSAAAAAMGWPPRAEASGSSAAVAPGCLAVAGASPRPPPRGSDARLARREREGTRRLRPGGGAAAAGAEPRRGLGAGLSAPDEEREVLGPLLLLSISESSLLLLLLPPPSLLPISRGVLKQGSVGW
jgi:hypothetical protein